jgi:hypothetical protein
LPDGTAVFHPIGELRVDRDDQKVCCGLCGRWFRTLGGHLGPAHGWSADDYRVLIEVRAAGVSFPDAWPSASTPGGRCRRRPSPTPRPSRSALHEDRHTD